MKLTMTAVAMVMLSGASWAGKAADDGDLLKTRETVWRAWFANDTKALNELVPPGTIVISATEEKWKDRDAVIREAGEFQVEGGRLLKLEFPRTEVQHFGNVAVIYSQYVLETEANGKRSSKSGRVTEIFVRKHGKWTNPGWHTD